MENLGKHKKIVILITLAFAFIAGCGKKTDTQTTADSTATQQDKVTQQTTEDGTTPGTTSGTQNTIPGNELGMSAGVPPDFPSDIPQPKNGKVIGSLMSSDGMVVNFHTDVPVKEVVEFYKTEMIKNGYRQTESGDMLMKDNGGMIGFNKPKERDVQLMLSSDGNVTSVVITYK